MQVVNKYRPNMTAKEISLLCKLLVAAISREEKAVELTAQEEEYAGSILKVLVPLEAKIATGIANPAFVANSAARAKKESAAFAFQVGVSSLQELLAMPEGRIKEGLVDAELASLVEGSDARKEELMIGLIESKLSL